MSNEDIKILNSQIKDLQNQKHKLQEEKKKDKYAKDKRKKLEDLLGKIVPEGFSIISDDVQEFLDAIEGFYYRNWDFGDKGYERNELTNFINTFISNFRLSFEAKQKEEQRLLDALEQLKKMRNCCYNNKIR